jgi:hypothetical protein
MPDHRALPGAAELEKAAAAEYPNQIKFMSSRQRFSREARKGAETSVLASGRPPCSIAVDQTALRSPTFEDFPIRRFSTTYETVPAWNMSANREHWS